VVVADIEVDDEVDDELDMGEGDGDVCNLTGVWCVASFVFASADGATFVVDALLPINVLTGVDKFKFLNGLSSGVEREDAGSRFRSRLRRGVLARLLPFSGELSDPPDKL
jgi:hypothetical protein